MKHFAKSQPAPQGPADLILHNGAILSLDEQDSVHYALAVHGNTISALNEDALSPALLGPKTSVVDMDGGAAIPGINDSHLHGAWLGALWPRTVFGPQRSGDDPEPETPLLRTSTERREAITRTLSLAAELGITSYTEPGLGPGENAGDTGCFDEEVLQAYRDLAASNQLTCRVNILMLYGLLDGPSRLKDFQLGLEQLDRQTPNEQVLRIAGVKIFADGIPPMRNAWIHGCYPDGSSGGLLIEETTLARRQQALHSMIQSAHRAGLQIGIHATGDRSIDSFIEALSHTADVPQRRHYVIHGDLVNRTALRRLAELGIGLNMQSGIASHTQQWLADTLGHERSTNAWPIAEALGQDVHLSLSSDAPVLAPDWRQGIATADEWMGRAQNQRERMRVLLKCYTSAPARQDHSEHLKGELSVGKWADIAVLQTNPYGLDVHELPRVAINQTIFDGRLIYSRNETPARADA